MCMFNCCRRKYGCWKWEIVFEYCERDGEKVMSDVIIIGVGLVGLFVFIFCVCFGLKVFVIDEFMKLGGRLLG